MNLYANPLSKHQIGVKTMGINIPRFIIYSVVSGTLTGCLYLIGLITIPLPPISVALIFITLYGASKTFWESMLLKIAVIKLQQEAAQKQWLRSQSSCDGAQLSVERSYFPSKELRNTPSSESRNNTKVDSVDRKQRTAKLL